MRSPLDVLGIGTPADREARVAELFAAYMVEPDRMKPRFVQRAMLAEDVSARARVVADFIAGMTDRYAAREHELLTGLRLLG